MDVADCRFVSRFTTAVLCALIAGGTVRLSAHVVRGLANPTLATAFASSPSSGVDALIPLRWGTLDTGLRVACFSVANTSPERMDRSGWPRVTAVAVELPGTRSGFTLLEPSDGDWRLIQGATVDVGGHAVTLDFAVIATTNPTGRTPGDPDEPGGIPPGQPASRGSGTRFCVSGPFPDELVPGQPTTIEQILNGVVVQFRGLTEGAGALDVGVWDNPARVIPLYP